MKKRIVVSVIEILLACLVIVAMLFGTFYVSRKIDQRFFTGKSYIYLYPEEDNTPISVSLSDDTVYASEDPYPTFSNESTWNVKGDHDGFIECNGEYYNKLGRKVEGFDWKWDFRKGYCVSKEETYSFIYKSLKQLGVNDFEAREFLHDLPWMDRSPYNVISFQSDIYQDHVKLKTEPESDTVNRIFMVWYPSKKKINIEPQKLATLKRKDFDVLELGYTETEKWMCVFSKEDRFYPRPFLSFHPEIRKIMDNIRK